MQTWTAHILYWRDRQVNGPLCICNNLRCRIFRRADINSSLRGNLVLVMNMKYEDPNMEAYWNSLPASVQAIIQNSGIEICSLGMLRKLGDYYQNGEGQSK